MMMWPYIMGGISGGWGIVGMILMLIFWAAVIVGVIFLVIWMVRALNYRRQDFSGSSRAIEILRERYARGEITGEEFERMKKDLI